MTTYNVGRYEQAKIACELEANPQEVAFVWKHNTSVSESLDIPSTHVNSEQAKSIFRFKPISESVSTWWTFDYFMAGFDSNYTVQH